MPNLFKQIHGAKLLRSLPRKHLKHLLRLRILLTAIVLESNSHVKKLKTLKPALLCRARNSRIQLLLEATKSRRHHQFHFNRHQDRHQLSWLLLLENHSRQDLFGRIVRMQSTLRASVSRLRWNKAPPTGRLNRVYQF